MKAKLEFNLPDEQNEFQMAIKGHLYLSVINEFFAEIRKALKYEDLNDDQIHTLERARTILINAMKELE